MVVYFDSIRAVTFWGSRALKQALQHKTEILDTG